jgi:hypothetical protein
VIRACVPMALQIVIDDVGWWTAEDTSTQGGPFRTAMPRDHVPADYTAIIELGRRLNMRPQAAFVLCDWDRENILAQIPSATWMGNHWQNPHRNNPQLEEAADLVRTHPDQIEPTLHALGHEYWIDGLPTRAEWHDRSGQMRPADDVRRHLDAFGKILDVNRLGPFPTAFVPSAFLHRFGVTGGGLAALLAEYGIRYLSTPWQRLFFDRPPEAPDFGFDACILTVDRGNDACRWFEVEPRPNPDAFGGPIIGMHWPNLLARNPASNGEVVERWVAGLKPLDVRFDRLLGVNTANAFSQLVHHRWVELALTDASVNLDWTRIAKVGGAGLLKTFFLKIQVPRPSRFTAENLRLLAVSEEIPGQWRLQLERPDSPTQGRITVQ